jgi:hypothetical protein
MPINSNFVFTDPVAANQAVQMAQIAALENAERSRGLSAMTESYNRRGIARDQLKSNEAITGRQMDQRDRESADRNRLVSRELDITEQDINLRRQMDAGRAAIYNNKLLSAQDREAGLARFDAMAALIDSEDPPTASELEKMLQQYASIITPESADILRISQKGRVSAMGKAADMGDALASKWNGRMNSRMAGSTPDQVIDSAQKEAGKYIMFDPLSGQFRSMFTRPRPDARDYGAVKDVPTVPPTAPAVPSITDLLGKRNSVRGLVGAGPVREPGAAVDADPNFGLPVDVSEMPATGPAPGPRLPPRDYGAIKDVPQQAPPPPPPLPVQSGFGGPFMPPIMFQRGRSAPQVPDAPFNVFNMQDHRAREHPGVGLPSVPPRGPDMGFMSTDIPPRMRYADTTDMVPNNPMRGTQFLRFGPGDDGSYDPSMEPEFIRTGPGSDGGFTPMDYYEMRTRQAPRFIPFPVMPAMPQAPVDYTPMLRQAPWLR